MYNFEEKPLGVLLEERDKSRMVYKDTDSPYIYTSTTLTEKYRPPFAFSSSDKLYSMQALYYEDFHVPTKLIIKRPDTWYYKVTRSRYGFSLIWRPVRKRLLLDLLMLYVLFFFLSANTYLREIIVAAADAIAIGCSGFVENYIAAPILYLIQPIFDFVFYLVYIVCGYAYTVFLLFRRTVGPYTRHLLTHGMLEMGWDDPEIVYEGTLERLVYMIPNNFYCVGAYWWAFIIVDLLLILVWFGGFAGQHSWERVPFYVYAVLKGVTLALPLLYISPNDRLFLWSAVLIVMAAEVAIGINLAYAVSEGFSWAFARWHMYYHWMKCFQYQTATSNNAYLRRFYAFWFYPFVKCYMFGFDALCGRTGLKRQPHGYTIYNKALYVQRLYYPDVGTTGFATRNRIIGYKSPGRILLERRNGRRHRRWNHVAEVYEQRGIMHHARARMLWEIERQELLAEFARLSKSGKLTQAIFDTKCVQLHEHEPLNAFAYTWWHQGMRDLPYTYREWLKPRHMTSIRFFFEDGKTYGLLHYSAPKLGGSEYIRNYMRRRRSSIVPDLSYVTALLEQDTAANLKYGLLFILAISSLTVYSIILAGWSSNSKYAFIGALRSAAQMISYEVAISLLILPVVFMAGSLNITMIVYMQSITVWFVFPLLPAAMLFVIAMLAETNRTPFDLPEAEAELVAGYNVDYSALPFAMFFLGEYCNMILISVLFCLLFLGGWTMFGVYGVVILVAKATVAWFYFVHVRATLPRYRYDQLMDNGWKIFLPVAGGFFIFIVGALIGLDALPVTGELPLQESARFTAARNAIFPKHQLSFGLFFLCYPPP
jgi:NADH:ubiquinone oxidoreductase subunit H